jgi:ABC-2 type transport system ATP-binding protein
MELFKTEVGLGIKTSESMDDAIVVENIYKKFGKTGLPFWKTIRKAGGAQAKGKSPVVALDHVSFTVRPGEIFGVLGPNGGGKSTLIRLLSTLLLPDGGQICVFGNDVVRNPMAVQRIINRVSVEASFVKKLNSIENLSFILRLYGLSGNEIRRQTYEILTRLGLDKESINKPMEQLSRGMQQKVAVSRALLTNPKLLLLDEPTTGLDPRSKREVQEIVKELRDKNGTTILLTTHDMVEAENLCDRIAIITKGKIVALDTPDNLRKMVPRTNGHIPSMEDVFLELTGSKLEAEDAEIGVEA